MVFFRSVLIVSLALAPAAVLNAWPSFALTRPEPGHCSIRDLWNVSTDADSTYPGVWLEAFLYKDSLGQVFHARTDTFTLDPGHREFRYDSVAIAESSIAPGFEMLVTGEEQLPTGVYTFEISIEPVPGRIMEMFTPDSAVDPFRQPDGPAIPGK